MNIDRRILIGAAALVALVIAVLGWQVKRLAAESRANAFRADSIAAATDTSRDVTAALAKLIGDSVRASELRILQVTPDRDEIDRALSRTTASVAALTAQVRGLSVATTGEPVRETQTSSGSVRLGDFTVREPPYTARAKVELPPPPEVGRLALEIALDPAPIVPRIQCGARVSGVRPATLLVTTPSWLTVTVDSVRADPNVCNPEPEDCRIPIIRTRCLTRKEVLIGGVIAGAVGGAVAAKQLSDPEE